MLPFRFQDDGYLISGRSFSATDAEEMCDKPGERARRFLLEETNKCKQNRYVIEQTKTKRCNKVPLRPPRDRVHLGDIKKRVATKNTILKLQTFHRVWSGFLTFRKHHAPSQCWEILAQWHDVTSQKIWILKVTAVITRNLARISKSRMSKVSLSYLALVVSLTFRPL